MSINFNKDLMHLRQALLIEERNYINSLKADKEFHIVKEIRMKIKKLKAQIAEQDSNLPDDTEDAQGQYLV